MNEYNGKVYLDVYELKAGVLAAASKSGQLERLCNSAMVGTGLQGDEEFGGFCPFPKGLRLSTRSDMQFTEVTLGVYLYIGTSDKEGNLTNGKTLDESRLIALKMLTSR